MSICFCLRGRIVCHVGKQLSEKVKPKKACIFDRKVADRMASPTCTLQSLSPLKLLTLWLVLSLMGGHIDMLTAEQLLMTAASNDGALQAARILSRKQRSGDLTFATARQVLV